MQRASDAKPCRPARRPPASGRAGRPHGHPCDTQTTAGHPTLAGTANLEPDAGHIMRRARRAPPSGTTQLGYRAGEQPAVKRRCIAHYGDPWRAGLYLRHIAATNSVVDGDRHGHRHDLAGSAASVRLIIDRLRELAEDT